VSVDTFLRERVFAAPTTEAAAVDAAEATLVGR
jgi:hypothetical protein